MNIKSIGMFGQSGAGKTTILRHVSTKIGEYEIVPCIGIVRYLYQKNDRYLSPQNVITKFYHPTPNQMTELVEEYVRSQFQLMNDYSTEMYLLRKEYLSKPTKSILVFDKSPIDFYANIVCGLSAIRKEFDVEINNDTNKLISLAKTTAEKNSKTLMDAVIITHPWSSTDEGISKDGLRDHYMSDEFTGDNWYGIVDTLNLSTDTFAIGKSSQTLESRVKEVVDVISTLAK